MDHNAQRFEKVIDCLRDGATPPLENEWFLKRDLEFFGPFLCLEDKAPSSTGKKAPDYEKDLRAFTGKKRARMEMEQN